MTAYVLLAFLECPSAASMNGVTETVGPQPVSPPVASAVRYLLAKISNPSNSVTAFESAIVSYALCLAKEQTAARTTLGKLWQFATVSVGKQGFYRRVYDSSVDGIAISSS